MREWLKKAREDSGLTMKTIADKLGVSESYYCAIENGTRQKKMDIVLASGLSAALGVPLAVIVKNEGNEDK